MTIARDPVAAASLIVLTLFTGNELFTSRQVSAARRHAERQRGWVNIVRVKRTTDTLWPAKLGHATRPAIPNSFSRPGKLPPLHVAS